MITIELTKAEAYALIDFLWGEESDADALRTANEKVMAAVGAPLNGQRWSVKPRIGSSRYWHDWQLPRARVCRCSPRPGLRGLDGQRGPGLATARESRKTCAVSGARHAALCPA
jgi:hypothetical protein